MKTIVPGESRKKTKGGLKESKVGKRLLSWLKTKQAYSFIVHNLSFPYHALFLWSVGSR